jgi:uncharacterized membrane protein
MQIHTSLGVNPMGAPFAPGGSLRDVVVRNGVDQLDPGGFGVLLHVWMLLFGTQALALRTLSGLLVLVGLAALASLAGRWLRHPLAPPAAVALAIVDPLVREHALEIRPYALELAGVFMAFWAADRLLDRPERARGLLFGLVLVALLGSRYSAFMTGAALSAAAVLHLWSRRDDAEGPQRNSTILATVLPPALAVAVIAVVSVPALIRRATWNGGVLVDYFSAQTAGAHDTMAALAAAWHHLTHPAALGLTVAAALALWPRRPPAVSAAALFVRRTALVLIVLTAALWPWHPWDPATKWSLYLRLVSIVCVVRLAADLVPSIATRRFARHAFTAASLVLVAFGTARIATHLRGRWDVALPALLRIDDGLAGGDTSVVAVDLHPLPAVRYHYEFGSLRGRPEYPRVFQLPINNAELPLEAMCRARWLLSFEPVERLAQRYPTLRFDKDPVTTQLLRITPADGSAGSPCDAPPFGPPIERGTSGAAR